MRSHNIKSVFQGSIPTEIKADILFFLVMYNFCLVGYQIQFSSLQTILPSLRLNKLGGLSLRTSLIQKVDIPGS